MFILFLKGFDLMEVGRDEVMLRMGKQANKRNIQFALQALLAVFGETYFLSIDTFYLIYTH